MCYRNPIRTWKYAFIILEAQYLQMTICYLQAFEKTLLHFVMKEMTEILLKA